MTNSLPTTPATQDQASRMTQLLVVFTASIFLSAALLFAVQPMFTKMVLPRLGGAPGVWSVAMVFFQACLLAGYCYAHLLTKYAPGRRSVMVHLGLMVVACFWLPLSIASSWGRPPVVGEAFWLLGLFAVSIGPPFFALAANAPLLQAWFARTDHPSANDPYFLYAASNIGSFLALLSYPILIEPLITLTSQTWFWAAGFIVLILLIAGCGYLLWQSPDKAPTAVAPEAASAKPGAAEAAPPTWGNVVRWVFLAAVPSGLLVAVTAHISTDVAAVPLLWVIPLALYLLTFVIVFSRKPIIPHWLVVEVQPVFVLALVAVIVYEPIRMIVGIMAVHLIVFFVLTLMCHGELASRRPPARYLTSFYMWMSFGGMIGGIASGLAAPYVFNWIAEYPILIALAVLCRPGLTWPKTTWQQVIVFGSVDPGGAHYGPVPAIRTGHQHRPVQRDARRPLDPDRAVLARSGAVRGHHRDRAAGAPSRPGGRQHHDAAQLLRRDEGQRDDERPVPDALARHHPARRAAHPGQAGQARHRAAGSRRCTTTTAPPLRRAWTPPRR